MLCSECVDTCGTGVPHGNLTIGVRDKRHTTPSLAVPSIKADRLQERRDSGALKGLLDNVMQDEMTGMTTNAERTVYESLFFMNLC